ncbi:hypothetical protein MMC30_008050 [Trapelia coarctata]|nr:hypothetical protein [Trapelia coarctata]
MQRSSLPLGALPAWLALNNVSMNGIAISSAAEGKGSGIFATGDTSAEDTPTLIAVPRDLVLSLSTIWEHAKSDHDLDQVLRATGDYGKTAKGAIVIFLLIQLTHASPSTTAKTGNATPWTTYIQFLPSTIPLPTFYTPGETALIAGTTLSAALTHKLSKTHEEYAHLRASTLSLPCCAPWWSSPSPLTLTDYMHADALYRSRAMDLPSTGLALVPVIDMANHASGAATNAHYDTDSNGNAVLILWGGKSPKDGEEIVITYGDDKGACEMLFSYGFIDPNLSDARTMFLDIGIPPDDPLAAAKTAAFDAPPGFRLFIDPASSAWETKVAWYGPFVWLQCINEEDGLTIKLAQLRNGDTELKKFWKGREVKDIMALERALAADKMLDVFRLRAYVSMNARINAQIKMLEETYNRFWGGDAGGFEGRSEVKGVVGRLGDLEGRLLRLAAEQFDGMINHLIGTRVVRKYLDDGIADEVIAPVRDESPEW